MTRIAFHFSWVIISLASTTKIVAQDYQAMHGSKYAGSLGVYNNPASIVSTPYAWDITPLAIGLKYSTNAMIIENASLFSMKNAETKAIEGERKRAAALNQDLRLLNARFRLNDISAIAFGATMRTYLSTKTSKYNWQDSIGSLRDFMAVNTNNLPLSATSRLNSWIELYGTYARTLIDNGNALMNAGITVKVNRGVGGAYLTAENIGYTPGTVNGQPGYYIQNGQLEYAYTSAFDELDNNGSFSDNRKAFFRKTYSSLAVSLGAEFTIFGADDADYSLKLGAAINDIGYNSFQYSSNSRKATMNKLNISDSLLQAVFEDMDSADDLPDSLQAVAGSISQQDGNFRMVQPTRLVLNADKPIADNFYINAEITVPLTALLGTVSLSTRQLNLVAVTPRYEKRAFGFYMPMTFNTHNQFWIGGALRAGPLLLGIHNFGNLFGKKSMQNGGGYLALTFRPGSKRDNEEASEGRSGGGGERREKASRRQMKQLGCPSY